MIASRNTKGITANSTVVVAMVVVRRRRKRRMSSSFASLSLSLLLLLLVLSLSGTMSSVSALPSYQSILGFVTPSSPTHNIPGLVTTKGQRQRRSSNWRLLRGGTAGTSSSSSSSSTGGNSMGGPEQSPASSSTSSSTVLSLTSPSQEPQSSSASASASTATSTKTNAKSGPASVSAPAPAPPQRRLDYNASATDAGSLSLQELLARLQTKAMDVDTESAADDATATTTTATTDDKNNSGGGGGAVNRTPAAAAVAPVPGALRVDFTKTGLSDSDVQARLAQYGRNELQAQPKTSMWQLIAEQFQDRLVQILLAVAVLSAVFSVLQQQGGNAGTGAGAGTGTAVQAESLWKALVEPSVILAILFLNAATGVWQSMSADDSLAALQKMQAVLCRVQRNGGVLTEIPAADLVPGDILMLSVGDKIAADARLISLEQSLSLQVDQGSLTGESVTVGKLPGDQGMAAPDSPVQDQKGLLFAGTMVTAGRGRAIVVQTGMDTQFGKIQAGVTEAAATPVKTPLAAKLDDFGETLTWIIGVICLAVWLVSIPKMNDPSFANVWQGGIYYAKVAVALGVAAIPEGLPAVITLCLSLGTRRMAERNVIVRKLPSVETLGCVTVICTDKTGTLTTNEMTAVSLVLLEHSNDYSEASAVVAEHLIEGYSYSPMGVVEGVAYNTEVREHPLGAVADVAAVSALCNNAKIIGCDDAEEMTEEQGNEKTKKSKSKKSKGEENKKVYERVGEPTEAALCVLTEKLGGMSHYLEDGHLDRKGLHFNVPPSVLANANVMSWRDIHPRVATLEFSRDRKSMSVLCDFPEGDYPTAGELHEGVRSRKAGKRLLVKGAPNLLIERCTHVKFRDGTVSKMTGPIRRSIEEKLSEMACRPLRCLALAVKDSNELDPSLREFAPTEEGDVQNHPLLSDSANYRNIESGLTLVGIVGIKDPARPEVADSITECTRAGIRVLMITGDAKDTAVAIAREVNIFPPKDSGKPIKAFEGREFFNKPVKEQLRILAEDNIVFCRAEPVDKQRLVKMLQSLGEIPAMTGDGVNDAPALQQAAIGIAMGITGTEVSKEAADMILADDNFSTIVSAVEEGRRIYNNMQAFICFLISCNIGEICAIFFATLAGFPEPLTAMHLLWVNLVTDGPPATALGFNPPAPDLMDMPPRPTDEPIMTKWLLTRYCVTGLYVGLATIGVFAGHYVSQGISLQQLSSWSQCGEFWSPAAGKSCSDLFQGSGRMLPQTLALTTLVCMEMLKALSAVSVDSSIFKVGPQDNPALLLGVSGPFLLHLFVLYSSKLGFPGLGESFGMVPLSIDDWVNVLTWAAPILIVDEVLKAIGRYIHREDRKSDRSKKAVSS